MYVHVLDMGIVGYEPCPLHACVPDVAISFFTLEQLNESECTNEKRSVEILSATNKYIIMQL